jgi:hypothetical protein
MFSFLRCLCRYQKKGRTYLRPKTGTGMPKKERFRHAQFGRASSSVLLSKLPVLSWTAAEAANSVLLFILVVF